MNKALLLVAMLALLVASCGATPTPVPAAGFAVPWGTGDRAEYSLAVNGNTVASLTLTTAPGTGSGYILTTETTAGAVKDISKARVDDNLKPLAVTREVTGAGASDFALMTVYSGGKLSIESKTAQGTKATTIDVPAGSWDNDQSLFTIRALPLAEGYTTTFTIVVGISAAVAKTELAVAGKEQVETPAGSFSTYKVEMTVEQQVKLYGWYDVSAPHHLIKYETTAKTASGDVTTTVLLTKTGM